MKYYTEAQRDLSFTDEIKWQDMMTGEYVGTPTKFERTFKKGEKYVHHSKKEMMQFLNGINSKYPDTLKAVK